jgi:hypothetical protein
MGKVITGMRMTLDGYINDAMGSVEPLYPNVENLSETKLIKESIRNTGAVVIGAGTNIRCPFSC